MQQDQHPTSSDDNKQLLETLKLLKEETSMSQQKEELRQKYEQYKKWFNSAKAEKDQKSSELKILREEAKEPIPDIKELRVKYENLKILHQKEMVRRKDIEAKYENVNTEMQKKTKALDDIYSQIE